MKINFTKKKLLFFISIGVIACISSLTTLSLLAGAYKKNNSVDEPTAPNITEAQGTPAEEEASGSQVEEPPATPKIPVGYYIEVNRQQNVVMVYATYESGEQDLHKTFVASVGRPDSETIVGTFNITNRHESLYLVGDVWGRYAVRIDGRYYFHSVPYFSKGGSDWDDLEYLEYNKLGEPASAGCVRLAVADAKWIYDNIPTGTTVKIYDADTLPAGVTKPEPIRIDENSPNRGWDPTDPNPTNPWN